MPHIKKLKRYNFIEPIKELNKCIDDVGELNYVITRLCDEFTDRKYRSYNDVIGVLECVKLEMYRRVVAPYEDEKREINGDVYKKEM